MGETRKELEAEILEGDWSMIRTHLGHDIVITVSQDLSLLDVADAVANDDKAKVAEWISSGSLNKPTLPELHAWERQMDHRFRLIILYPYVLIQKIAH